MATISIAGTVTGRPGESPVTVKTFETGDPVVSFSVADRAYVYTKPGSERQGQFYRCEVRGKTAEIVMQRIQRGDKVGVSGQLVQRMYNEKLFLDIKNASVTFLDDRPKGEEQEVPF
jgi:single-stranded DNA-binding protein